MRPINEREKELIRNNSGKGDSSKHKDICVEFNPNDKTSLVVYTPNDKSDKETYEKHPFNFDHVFESESDQASVYEVAAKPIIQGS